MKLYYSPGACSLAPHIALEEAGISYSTEAVNLGTLHYKSGDFNQVNAKGYVPVLELGKGEILTEAAVILQYVADQAPERKLIPKAGTMERYRCQEWLNFIATEVHKGFGPLWDDRNADDVKARAKENLGFKFDFLSSHLKSHPYLLGDAFSVADIYLFTILNWTHFLKLDISKWPVLMGHMEKVRSRPAVMKTLKEEDLLD